jgi:hypothetical protein
LLAHLCSLMVAFRGRDRDAGDRSPDEACAKSSHAPLRAYRAMGWTGVDVTL